MKKSLLMGLTLLAAQSVGQAQALRECRVLAADEWITMGVTSMAGCFKYAEAAATPDEPQYAQLGNVSLMLRNGQYFQSNDGGQAWKRIQPFSTQPGLSTLNALQTPENAPEEPAAPPRRVAEPRVEPRTETPAVAAAPPPVPVERPAPVRRKPSPARPVEIAPQPSPPPASVATETASAQRDPEPGPARPCQVRVNTVWQVTPAESLERCAEVVYSRMSRAGRAEASGYWSGMYLVVTESKVFKSSNGRDWLPLKE